MEPETPVPHGATDPLRGALIAGAPLMLVPPLLVAIALAFGGTSDPSQLRHLLPRISELGARAARVRVLLVLDTFARFRR